VGVLENGGPISSVWMRDNQPAIIELRYPGEQGGVVLADVLFGDYNPACRLIAAKVLGRITINNQYAGFFYLKGW